MKKAARQSQGEFEFWLGRAGSGKTRACVEAIARRLEKARRGPLLLWLVPEQASAQAERALAGRVEGGAFARARVVTFAKLREEAFERTGGRPRETINDAERVLLLRQVIRRARAELQTPRASASATGWAEAAGKTLLELRRYGWRAGELRLFVAQPPTAALQNEVSRAKLADLALIWERYEAELDERGLIDSAALPDLACERLAQWEELGGAALWIDGFVSFTDQERRSIEALLGRCERAALALCLDARDPAFRTRAAGRIGPERVFEPVERTYHQWRARVEELGWRVKDVTLPRPEQPTRFGASGALHYLESRALLSLTPEPMTEAEAIENGAEAPIEFIEAEDREAEIEAAARRAVGLIGAGLRPREVALIARDLTHYGPIVRRVFARFEIPFFLDARRPIAGHPLARPIVAAAAIAERGRMGEEALDYLKSGLTSLGESDEVALIESFVRRRRIAGDDWMDEAAWTAARRRDEGRSGAELFAAWSRAAAPLVRCVGRLRSGEGADPARALWSLLDELGAAARIEAWIAEARARGDEEGALLHEAAWGETVALLERIDRIGLSSSPIDLGELREVVEGALAAARAGLIPPTLDQVVVGSVERSRTPDVRAVFVLGLVDGEFPLAHEEDAMLTDRERALLATGREVGPDSERRFGLERYLAYIAMTRASEKLVLCRPLVDTSGRAAAASSYYRAARAAFPKAPLRRYGVGGRSSDPTEPMTADARYERLAAAYHAAAEEGNARELGRALIEAAPPPPNERARATLAALEAPRAAAIDAALARRLWSERPALPVTALEDYAHCPFKFFAGRVLKLERPAEPRLSVSELGDLRHRLLERLFERLGEGGPLDWGEVDGDLAARSIDEAAAEEGEASIAVEFGRDALTRAAIESAARDLKHFVRALIEMGRRYGFDQERSEWKFDGEGALRVPAIEGIEFALIGKVDRIDRARDGAKPRFVVFDYKSGGRELDPTKLVNGLDLQLPAYALALSGEGEVVGVFYWPMSIGLAEAEGESWAAPGTPEWFKKHRPAGLFRADAADLLDREVGPGGSSLAFGFARKKDGALKKTPFGHLPPEGMEAFLGDVRARMSEMAARIAEGRVEVAPWARKRERACELCDYAAVCRIGTLGASAFRAPKEMSKRAFFAQYGGDGVEDE